MLENGLTYVGTLRKNKAEIPKQLQASRSRPEHSSIHVFADKLTLVSYVSKKNKAVLAISTQHHSAVVEGEKSKPEIICYYNDTKGGVDTLDQLISTFTVKRKSRRWPMVMFYNMIDVAGVAAYVIWLTNKPQWKISSHQSRRRLFLIQLGTDLVEEYIKRRVQQKRFLRKSAYRCLVTLGYIDPKERTQNTTPSSKGRCYLCPRGQDRKTSRECSSCGNKVCYEHVTPNFLCDECL